MGGAMNYEDFIDTYDFNWIVSGVEEREEHREMKMAVIS